LLQVDDYTEEKKLAGFMAPLSFKDISDKLTPGEHTVGFKVTDIKGRCGQLSISVGYHTMLPNNDQNCRVYFNLFFICFCNVIL
jgi:hypothetical protein